MATAGLAMTQAQYDRLRKIVYDRSGIHFKDSKKYALESRLARRLEELDFNNFDQYLTFITVGPYREDEFQEMFNRITINETSFFRNEPQLQVFETLALPKLLEARKADKKLRIWSSASSTGEEPYTLAMQVHRSLGGRLSEWNVEILGTDISEKALVAAQKAAYTDYALRSINPLVKQRYFKESNKLYQLDPAIQAMVHFELLNLKDTFAAKRFGTWDVIFCRNVMIYFDDDMRVKCVKMFYDQLAADGHLFIGHSETLRNLDVPFVSMSDPQAFGYTK